MYLTDILPRIRRLLYDTVTTYRFSDAVIVDWLNDGLSNIRSQRPDAKFDNDMAEITDTILIDELTGHYSYTDSSGYAYMSNLHNITGWVKSTYPTLYFKAISSVQINAYPTSADRTAATGLLFHAVACSTSGTKTIVDDAGGATYGGTFTLNKAVVSGAVWDITTAAALIPIDDVFTDAMIYYAASKVLESDSDDTQDQALSVKYYQRYIEEIRA